MYCRFIAYVFIFFGLNLTIQAQEISHQVLCSYGLLSKTSQGDMSATMGELAVQLFGLHTPLVITQGFQQPDKDHDTILVEDELFMIYPNPVIRDGTLKIRVMVEGNFIVSIYNSIGMKTEIRDFNVTTKGSEYIIPFAKYASGLYILHIKNTSGDISRYFKVEKIN
jgi:hypothetical protein